MHTRSITQMKDFFDVIDLIEFEVDGVKKEAIRFGYHIYEDDKLRWGSQTTLTEEKSILLELFTRAYKESWFKELIEGCRQTSPNRIGSIDRALKRHNTEPDAPFKPPETFFND